jgi:hypothetical protein
MEKTLQMHLKDLREQIAQEIEKACYFIPNEKMRDTGSGKPSAYVEGITNGRNQALSIIRGSNANGKDVRDTPERLS